MLKIGPMPGRARTLPLYCLCLVCLPCLPWLLGGCGSQLAGVVRSQAAVDLGCPEDQVEVVNLRSGNSVRDFSVRGCGRQEHYQAACNMTGSCQAYRPGEAARNPVPASEALTAGADDLGPADEGVTTVAGDAPGAADGAVAASAEVGNEAAEAGELAPAGTPSTPGETRLPPTEERAVTIRNNCGHRVVMYVGKQPGGDGRYMTLGSTNMITPRMRLGDQVWLLDDEQQAGLASVSIAGPTSEVEIAESCAGLTAR